MKTRKIGQTGRLRSADEWIYGLNPVLEALKAGRGIKTLYLAAGRHEKVQGLRQEADRLGISVKTLDAGFFDEKFGKGHQGVAADVRPRRYFSLDELLGFPREKGEIPLFFVLDCIEDPRNLGAILRVADAAGVHGVVLQAYRAAGLSAEVSKASAGAVEYVPVTVVANIKNALREMKEREITIVGA
ncbi:MAG: RNA methyltransferase, partial [Nitrospirota bacterium]